MIKKEHYVKEFESKHSLGCLWGTCTDCSRVVNGKGIHDIEVYILSKCDETYKCCDCHGEGEIERDCPHCDGFGTIQEECDACEGKGEIPDDCGEKTFVRKEHQLIKNN